MQLLPKRRPARVPHLRISRMQGTATPAESQRLQLRELFEDELSSSFRIDEG